MSREVELGCESWTSFASSCSSTAVQRTLSLWLCPSARQSKQQLRSTQVAGQWRGDTALTLPLFWRRSTVSPVFSGRYPRSSLHSFVPLSPFLISHLASVDVKKNDPIPLSRNSDTSRMAGISLPPNTHRNTTQWHNAAATIQVYTVCSVSLVVAATIPMYRGFRVSAKIWVYRIKGLALSVAVAATIRELQLQNMLLQSKRFRWQTCIFRRHADGSFPAKEFTLQQKQTGSFLQLKTP